jgi:hypothetical protein
MAVSLSDPVTLTDPLIDAVAIVILAASIRYVSRQQKSRYPDVNNLLILAYALFEFLLVLEFLRSFLDSDAYIYVYAVGGVSVVLWDVAILTLVGCLVYLRPSDPTFRARIRTVLTSSPHGFILVPFFAFILFSDLFVALAPHAFTIEELPNLFGVLSPLKTVAFGNAWLLQAFVVLVVFVGYSGSLFVASARKTQASARTTLYAIVVTWTAIGVELIVFNGYLVQLGHDLIGLGYTIAAIAFGFTAYFFRYTTTVASFFGPIDRQVLPPSNPFASKMGEQATSAGIFLLETDPTSGFEQAVRDFAVEKISNRVPVFVLTSRGDIVYQTLSKLEGVRFYLLSGSVSFPKATDHPYEMLVPDNDQAVLLDVVHKTVTSSEEGVGIVYNSISDMVMSWGAEGTYKFLKEVRELLLSPKVSALFLITSGAHEEKTMNLIRSLFPNHLGFDAKGLKVLKRMA